MGWEAEVVLLGRELDGYSTPAEWEDELLCTCTGNCGISLIYLY